MKLKQKKYSEKRNWNWKIFRNLNHTKVKVTHENLCLHVSAGEMPKSKETTAVQEVVASPSEEPQLKTDPEKPAVVRVKTEPVTPADMTSGKPVDTTAAPQVNFSVNFEVISQVMQLQFHCLHHLNQVSEWAKVIK